MIIKRFRLFPAAGSGAVCFRGGRGGNIAAFFPKNSI